jgi:hypothetical protein
MTTADWRRLLFSFTVVSALLCLGYGVFAFWMGGMAHSESNRFFSTVIGPLISLYGLLGLGLLAMAWRQESERLTNKALLTWSVVLLIGFFGSYVEIIRI